MPAAREYTTQFYSLGLTIDAHRSVVRGLRMLNGRKQVLLQDEITSDDSIMWRMHTNATVTLNGGSAKLDLGGKTLQATILSPSGATFTTMKPIRLESDPPLPAGQVDQENRGVTVLVINLPAGQANIQVLFNPQWSGMDASAYVTPKSVGLSDWSLTSHS